MKTKLWILGCALLMACGSSEERPAEILSHEEMVAFLIDAQVAQTRVNDLRLKSDSAQIVYDQYHEYLLAQHNLEDSAFYRSLQYYLSRPDQLDVIHEGVLDTLNFRLQKIEAQEEKDKEDKEENDEKKEELNEENLKKTPEKVS